jgi:membrane dipeptidase
MLKTWPDVQAHLDEWRSARRDSARLGYILSMEGADPILSPRDLVRWWEDGLRVVSLAHYGVSAYAHGTGTTGGLTPRGVDLLKAMGAFGQVVEHFTLPVLASHHNCRALVPGQRQLSDEQIRRLIERDSVIGVALDSWMLFPGYEPGKTDNSQITLKAVVDHIDHICQLAGNARHVAIGSDLDGGFGKEQSPSDLDTIADLQKIANLLRKRCYAEADVEAVTHANWMRFFRNAWSHAGGAS